MQVAEPQLDSLSNSKNWIHCLSIAPKHGNQCDQETRLLYSNTVDIEMWTRTITLRICALALKLPIRVKRSLEGREVYQSKAGEGQSEVFFIGWKVQALWHGVKGGQGDRPSQWFLAMVLSYPGIVVLFQGTKNEVGSNRSSYIYSLWEFIYVKLPRGTQANSIIILFTTYGLETWTRICSYLTFCSERSIWRMDKLVKSPKAPVRKWQYADILQSPAAYMSMFRIK